MKICIQTLGKDGTGRMAAWVKVPVCLKEVKMLLGMNYKQSGYELIGYVLPFEVGKKTSIEQINEVVGMILRSNEDVSRDMKRSFFQKEDKQTRILYSS